MSSAGRVGVKLFVSNFHNTGDFSSRYSNLPHAYPTRISYN